MEANLRNKDGEAEEASGTLSDIKEDSMLMIAFDETGAITRITVSERVQKTDDNNAQTL